MGVAVDVVWVVVAIGLAYLAGLASRPLLDRGAHAVATFVRRRRAAQHEILEELNGLLPELQKAGEASRDAITYRRCLELNLEVIEVRDRLRSGRIRNRVALYQDDLMRLVDLTRQEADEQGAPAMPEGADETGEGSGEVALKRVYALLRARQEAWEALAQALSSISGELRRL